MPPGRQHDDTIPCRICGRATPPRYREEHHLVPKSGNGRDTITVCINCGDQLHRLFTLAEMKETYQTVAAITADERVRKWVRWVRQRRSFRVPGKTMKRR